MYCRVINEPERAIESVCERDVSFHTIPHRLNLLTLRLETGQYSNSFPFTSPRRAYREIVGHALDATLRHQIKKGFYSCRVLYLSLALHDHVDY